MFIKTIERVRGGGRLDTAQTLVKGLGVFSLALGGFELATGGRLAKWLGMPASTPLLKGYGAREAANGVGLLAAQGARLPAAFMWMRLAGDVADLATLGLGLKTSKRKVNVMIALGSVAAVTALDLVCALQLTQNRKQLKTPVRDYAARSGFPKGAEAVWGVAARELKEGKDWWNAWRKDQGRGETPALGDGGRDRHSTPPEPGRRASGVGAIEPAGRA